MINKLKRFADSIFDLVLPKDAEIAEIENLSKIDILNLIPEANEIENQKYKAVFQYKNKLTRKAIWAIKYRKNQKILKNFSEFLYEFILENISDEIMFSKFENPLLVPIPMHKNNIKIRGYNQS